MSQQWMDDDRLLEALGEALRSGQRVPAEFIAIGKSAFSWRDIDAELAILTYDSVLEDAEAELAGVRSEPANLRYLTFTSGEFSIEIEVTADAVLGQLVPPGPGRVEVRTADGATLITAIIHQGGGFTIRPVPRGSFRLYCHSANSASIVTNWLVLQDPPGD